MTEVEETGLTARQRIRQEVSATEKAVSKDVTEMLVQIDIAAFDYKTFKNFVNLLGSHRRRNLTPLAVKLYPSLSLRMMPSPYNS